MTMRPCSRGSIWRIAKNSDVLKVDDKALIREIEAEMISIRTVSKMGY